MRVLVLLLLVLGVFDASADERDRNNLKRCEEAAVLVTSAYSLHPNNAQERVDFINREKARMAKIEPSMRLEDRYLLPPLVSVPLYLAELNLIDSSTPLSSEIKVHIAARAGAACGLLIGKVGTP